MAKLEKFLKINDVQCKIHLLIVCELPDILLMYHILLNTGGHYIDTCLIMGKLLQNLIFCLPMN